MGLWEVFYQEIDKEQRISHSHFFVYHLPKYAIQTCSQYMKVWSSSAPPRHSVLLQRLHYPYQVLKCPTEHRPQDLQCVETNTKIATCGHKFKSGFTAKAQRQVNPWIYTTNSNANATNMKQTTNPSIILNMMFYYIPAAYMMVEEHKDGLVSVFLLCCWNQLLLTYIRCCTISKRLYRYLSIGNYVMNNVTDYWVLGPNSKFHGNLLLGIYSNWKPDHYWDITQKSASQ